ncbi:hypothetical protein [Streptomyces sp. NPDC088816]|uniref:hypothetical protein n=1 Tax=Streptomyces sp. NPDC088816 TaxID=3365906 RepID=UPI003811A180
MADQEEDRRVGIVGTLGIIVGLACAVLVIGTPILSAVGNPFRHGPSMHSQPTPTPTPTIHVIDNPELPDDAIHGYWYCWNTGALAPHHLGHRVSGDHLCTRGELRFAGVTD